MTGIVNNLKSLTGDKDSQRKTLGILWHADGAALHEK
jgi:hypothetical protein